MKLLSTQRFLGLLSVLFGRRRIASTDDGMEAALAGVEEWPTKIDGIVEFIEVAGDDPSGYWLWGIGRFSLREGDLGATIEFGEGVASEDVVDNFHNRVLRLTLDEPTTKYEGTVTYPVLKIELPASGT